MPPTDAADFHVLLKLLEACNTCLDQVQVVGCEQTLQQLGSSCFDAMSGTKSSEFSNLTVSGDKTAGQLTAALVTDLAATTCQLPAVLEALQAGMNGAVVSFPKAQKLVEFLTQMTQAKSAWHGIVFVRTRSGVYALTALLQKAAGLGEVSFSPLTGHGKSVAAVTSAMQGMNIRRQAETLDRFKAAQGRNVLIATAAAEEGIDIPRCEFAVSYTVVESGREWTQRQGRARMLDSQFVSIIERGTNDWAQLCKSKQEAENEYAAVIQSCFIV